MFVYEHCMMVQSVYANIAELGSYWSRPYAGLRGVTGGSGMSTQQYALNFQCV